MKIIIKNKNEIKLLKKACKITSQILDEVSEIIKPGISTEDINLFVHKRTAQLKATPAPLNYEGFPKSVCTSINEVICHGIPSTDVILKSGDIINVDITSIKNGFFGDASRMYFVGGREACSDEAVKLVDFTELALEKAIEVVKPGNLFSDIGKKIEEVLKDSKTGFSIVRDYTGHGIGRSFHEAPQILHYFSNRNNIEIKEGMTFTIEPMINVGSYKTELDKKDNWTVRTIDGSLSAQWEHTLVVTKTGADILTI